jgi:hypothetical protein
MFASCRNASTPSTYAHSGSQIARGQDLRADGRRMPGQQRQQRMGRTRRDDLDPVFVLEFFERVHQVAAITTPRFACLGKFMVIHPGQLPERPVPVRPMDLFFRQDDQIVQMPLITLLQQRVEQHRTKRRRQRQCDRRVHLVAAPAFENLQQGDIRLGDGFEQPAFFQELVMFRMAHERQVCVQDERKIPLHGLFQLVAHPMRERPGAGHRDDPQRQRQKIQQPGEQ